MAIDVNLKTSPNFFQLIGPNGEEGPRSCWDEKVAVIKVGNEVFQCICDDPESDEYVIERVLKTEQVAVITEPIEVEFDDEDLDDDDDVDDDDDDPDDDPDPGEEIEEVKKIA